MATLYVVSCDCGWEQTYTTPGRAERGTAGHVCVEPARLHRRSCRACGWSGQYSSAAKADYCKRRHSCELRLARVESRSRRLARAALVDRTPKPCLHPIARHEHGTHACYVLDQCKCPPCSAANAAYEDNRKRQQAYGRWDNYVDAEPARAHIRALMAQGMGLPTLIKRHGLSGGQLNKLLYGTPRPDGSRRPPCRRIAKGTSERLLAVRLELADGATVDGADTARRLQALVACGWSHSALARHLGMQGGNFWRLIHEIPQPTSPRRRPEVTVARARQVHALYRDLADTPPPTGTRQERASVTRARRYAAEHQWPPPLRVSGRLILGQALPQRDDDEVSA